MKKLRIDDVLPPQRKSIRSLSIEREIPEKFEIQEEIEEVVHHHAEPAHRKGHEKAHTHTTHHVAQHTSHHQAPTRSEFAPETIIRAKSSGRRYVFWSIACGAVGIFIFFLVNTLSGATISIVPMTSKVDANFSFKGTKDPGTGDIQYSTVALSQDAAAQIPYTDKKTTNTKAAGQIQLINSSTAAQKLVATTRLESTDGKIYRLVSAVTIPAKKGTQAGVINANVQADQPGPTYNASSTTFTIPGLKTNPAKFKAITGRTLTAGIKGGATGVLPIIKPADLKNIQTSLRDSLTKELNEKILTQVPKDSILYTNTAYLTFESEAPAIADAKNALVTEKATAHGIIIKKSDLAALIAKKTINSYRDEQVAIPDVSKLSLKLQNSSPETIEKGTITGIVQGSTTIQWIVSEEGIRKSVLGIPQGQFESMMAKVDGLQKVHLLLTPFWKSSLPNNPEKIKIITKYE